MQTNKLERFINVTASVVAIVASVKWEPLRNFWDNLDPWGVTLIVAVVVLLFMGAKDLFYFIIGRHITTVETAEVQELKNVSYRSTDADIEFAKTDHGTFLLTKTIKRGKGPTVSWSPDRLYIIDRD